MPLVIAVLIIIVCLVVNHDTSKEDRQRRANMAMDMRKTNATLERETVDKYMRNGMEFHKAYDAATEEMVRLGYVPCIPMDAYEDGSAEETSMVKDPQKYDSYIVQQHREHINYSANDSVFYRSFPDNEFAYKRELNKGSLKAQMIDKGGRFVHPDYGTCEVIDYTVYNSWFSSSPKAKYVVRVVATDKIVDTIAVGDKSIRRL